MGKNKEDRLEELLDQRDTEIEELRERVLDLERRLNADPFVWALPSDSSDARSDLPVPRLELVYTPDADAGWRVVTVVYRMVYRHFYMGRLAHVVFGQTTIRGGREEPPRHGPKHPHAGKIDLPYRDGAHICHDMGTLKMPGYAICDGQVDDLTSLAGKPHERW